MNETRRLKAVLPLCIIGDRWINMNVSRATELKSMTGTITYETLRQEPSQPMIREIGKALQ